ncbi:MAG: sugar ABC transporter ATP-binding protein [Deltaproteobacteria bacterium]|nr:sugar ABC transporter ATP-binding protein [Deltaproteobacteria bacterium]
MSSNDQKYKQDNETITPVLETCALTKHYGGVHALTDADFKLMPGEHAAIVGDNGAGKSTLVRNITGVEQPTSGRILLDTHEVTFKSPSEAREHGIETVYQNLALADDLDVPGNIFLGRENVKFRLGPFSWLDKPSMHGRSESLLKEIGIKIPKLNTVLRNMSGGQRQCVAICRAAGWGSKLIIMDEPTAALGIQETKRVEEIIMGLKERSIPVIIISHNLRQVFNLVDRIWIFRQGRIVGNRLVAETDTNEIVSMITGVSQTENQANSYM